MRNITTPHHIGKKAVFPFQVEMVPLPPGELLNISNLFGKRRYKKQEIESGIFTNTKLSPDSERRETFEVFIPLIGGILEL
jgi:hypothetical protein